MKKENGDSLKLTLLAEKEMNSNNGQIKIKDLSACPFHTYIHTYIHAYIHTYIHIFIYTYISLICHTARVAIECNTSDLTSCFMNFIVF